MAQLGYLDNRFDRFTQYELTASNSLQKRRPRPFEALVETARRLDDISSTQRIPENIPVQATLGGSASYGGFLHVRGHMGHTASSDVDLILVIPDYGLLGKMTDQLATFPRADYGSVQSLAKRAKVFKHECLDDNRTVFSHKISIGDSGSVSIRKWCDRVLVASTDVVGLRHAVHGA